MCHEANEIEQRMSLRSTAVCEGEILLLIGLSDGDTTILMVNYHVSDEIRAVRCNWLLYMLRDSYDGRIR